VSNIIPCHFVYWQQSVEPDGKKLQAACAIGGKWSAAKKEGIDYTETFAPTTNMATIRTVLTTAAQRDWEIPPGRYQECIPQH